MTVLMLSATRLYGKKSGKSSSRAANDLDNDDEVDHDDEMSLCKCLCTMGQ